MSSTALGRLLTGDLREIEYRSVRFRNHLHHLLAPKGDRDRRMLFAIGHPRSGTLTLHSILLANGVNSRHSSGRWQTARFDAFGDRGNFQPFRLLDRCFPNSWFILNTRPAFHYIRSLYTYWYAQRRGSRIRLLGRVTRRGVKGEILRRNRHFLDVVRYFDDRGNLLVVDIEEPGAFDFLCARLGITNPGGVWRNRSQADLHPLFEGTITDAFVSMGIAAERMNPFIFRSLLRHEDAFLVSRFLSRHQDRIHMAPNGGQA